MAKLTEAQSLILSAGAKRPDGWQADSARGAMSGALGKLGLIVTSAKEAERGRVYRIEQQPVPWRGLTSGQPIRRK